MWALTSLTLLNLRSTVVILLSQGNYPVKGLGKLYAYDTALFIGFRLGLLPKKVYLHAGTRKGAEALGLAGEQLYLHRPQLPASLQVLKACEIEDFLCI